MPALPFVNKALRYTHKWLFNDTTVAIARYYEQYTGAPPVVSDLLTLGALFGTGFTADLAPVFSPNLSYSSVEITDLSSATAASAEVPFVGLVGTETGPDLPAATCGLIGYEIPRRYRGGKPKNFVPFGTQSDLLTDQTWEVASATGFLDSWGSFISIGPDNPWGGAGVLSAVNVSFYEGFTSVQNPVTLRWRNVPTPRAVPIVDTITAITIAAGPHFQTRRGKISG